jgi:hypothetical protein
MGRGISKILGRIARSIGGVFGKDSQATAKEGSQVTRCARPVLQTRYGSPLARARLWINRARVEQISRQAKKTKSEETK